MTNARTIFGTANAPQGRDRGDMGGRGERELRAGMVRHGETDNGF